MIGLNLQIEDRVSPYLGGLTSEMQGSVWMLAGREVANGLREHFQVLEDTRPNKQGWPRQHFWSKVRRSVNAPRTEGGDVVVSINHVGIAQRYFGGPIEPVRAKYLTIPAIAEAYGRRAGEFDFLRVGLAEDENGRMRLALVEAAHSTVKISKGKGGVKVKAGEQRGEAPRAFYWLVKRVNQAADPSVLPSMSELADRAVAAIARWWNRRRGYG